jgi:hypothetical protein
LTHVAQYDRLNKIDTDLLEKSEAIKGEQAMETQMQVDQEYPYLVYVGTPHCLQVKVLRQFIGKKSGKLYWYYETETGLRSSAEPQDLVNAAEWHRSKDEEE